MAAVAGDLRQPRDLGAGRLTGRDRDGAFQPREVEGLRGGREHDPARGGVGADAEEAGVVGTGKDHRGVDLVGEDPAVVGRGDRRDALQLVAPEHRAGRVVRVAEDEHPGPGGEGAIDALEVELPPAREPHARPPAARPAR